MHAHVLDAEGHAKRPGIAEGTGAGLATRTAALAEMFAANAARHDAEDSFVAENYAALKREGLFKAHVPVEFGGGGASYGEICAAVRAIAAGCGSTGLAFAMHTHIVALALWRFRNEGAPTDGLLKRAAKEDLVLISSGGADWLPSSGKAVKVDGGYRVTARKSFASGSPAGDLLVTSAVLDDPSAEPTVLHFAVPFKAEGVSIIDTWRVMGMRGSASHDVQLSDVFVPDAAIAGRRPQGKWSPLFHGISMIAFPIVYSAYLGVADHARAKALEIARSRPADEATVMIVGEMEAAHAAARMAVAEMIGIAETSKPGPETTNRGMLARALAVQCAIGTVERAMEVAGGGAFFRDRGIERAFRDIQGARYHPLREKQRLRLAGRMALGLDIDG